MSWQTKYSSVFFFFFLGLLSLRTNVGRLNDNNAHCEVISRHRHHFNKTKAMEDEWRGQLKLSFNWHYEPKACDVSNDKINFCFLSFLFCAINEIEFDGDTILSHRIVSITIYIQLKWIICARKVIFKWKKKMRIIWAILKMRILTDCLWNWHWYYYVIVVI